MKPDLRVLPDVAEMSLRAAEATVATINGAVRVAGRCSLVLAGGSTPRMLYGLLASQFRAQVPWEHVHVFWGMSATFRPAIRAATTGWPKRPCWIMCHVRRPTFTQCRPTSPPRTSRPGPMKRH